MIAMRRPREPRRRIRCDLQSRTPQGETAATAAGSRRRRVPRFSPVGLSQFKEFFGQKNWYLRWTDELMSFDWNAGSGGYAQIPVGAALGKVFTIGKQPINMFLGANYNAAHRPGASKWDVKLNVTFLFPE